METKPGYPFKKPLEERPFTMSNLRQFKNNPAFTVREHRRSSEEFQDFEETVSASEIALKVKELFEEFNSQYHPCAPVHFIIAKEENEEIIYVVTEVIKEIPKEALSPEQLEKYYRECTALLETFVKYCEDKFESKEEFLTDVTILRQYVYTKKKGEKENHLYLVDTDPFSSGVVTDMIYVVKNLEEDIEKFEIESGTTLGPLRKRCHLLLDRIQNHDREENKK